MKNRIYSADIQPLMQNLLATLADIDFAHECELQQIETGSGDAALKEGLRAKLDASHRERREPYVQQLASLQARIKSKMPDVSQAPDGRDAA